MRVRCYWHILAGIATVWSSLVGWGLPVVCALGFLFYEMQQDKNKQTQSYLDIYEWTVVVYINTAILIILRLWGIL